MKVKSVERGKSCKKLYENIRWFNNFNLCLNNINKKINNVAIKSYNIYETALIPYNRIMDLMDKKQLMFLKYKQIENFINSLKEKERNILLKYCDNNFSVEEIAKENKLDRRNVYRTIQKINNKYIKEVKEIVL